MACAACGLIARVSAYQLTPLFRRFEFISNREPRYAWVKPIQSVFTDISPYLKNDLHMTVFFFSIVISCYFIGILGLVFLGLYSFILLSAFGGAEKTYLMSRGDMDVEGTADLRLAVITLSNISFQEVVSRHLSFLSMVILTVPFCLGGGRFISLIHQDNVQLSVNSNIVESKFIASTEAGLLFIASADAKVLRLATWRPTDYFLLMPNGKVVCFGERNINCMP